MNKRIVFGTSNQAKVDHLLKQFAILPVDIVCAPALGITVRVEEDGMTPEDNARKKACAYCAESGLPAFSLDSGLVIDRFPQEKQPGPFVRRIPGKPRGATDEEMVAYYVAELEHVGGESDATWQFAIALSTGQDTVYSRTVLTHTTFTAQASKTIMPGAPLNSIQIDEETGKYYSELTLTEREHIYQKRATELVEFLREHLVVL